MTVYPDDVFEHYAQFDVRASGNAYDYYVAAKLVFAVFLSVECLSARAGGGKRRLSG